MGASGRYGTRCPSCYATPRAVAVSTGRFSRRTTHSPSPAIHFVEHTQSNHMGQFYAIDPDEVHRSPSCWRAADHPTLCHRRFRVPSAMSPAFKAGALLPPPSDDAPPHAPSLCVLASLREKSVQRSMGGLSAAVLCVLCGSVVNPSLQGLAVPLMSSRVTPHSRLLDSRPFALIRGLLFPCQVPQRPFSAPTPPSPEWPPLAPVASSR